MTTIDRHLLRMEFPRTGPNLNKRRPFFKTSDKYAIAAGSVIWITIAAVACFLYAITQ